MLLINRTNHNSCLFLVDGSSMHSVSLFFLFLSVYLSLSLSRCLLYSMYVVVKHSLEEKNPASRIIIQRALTIITIE